MLLPLYPMGKVPDTRYVGGYVELLAGLDDDMEK
jgi:hypothetical protein